MNRNCPGCDASIADADDRVPFTKSGLTFQLYFCSLPCRKSHQNQDQEGASNE